MNDKIGGNRVSCLRRLPDKKCVKSTKLSKNVSKLFPWETKYQHTMFDFVNKSSALDSEIGNKSLESSSDKLVNSLSNVPLSKDPPQILKDRNRKPDPENLSPFKPNFAPVPESEPNKENVNVAFKLNDGNKWSEKDSSFLSGRNSRPVVERNGEVGEEEEEEGFGTVLPLRSKNLSNGAGNWQSSRFRNAFERGGVSYSRSRLDCLFSLAELKKEEAFGSGGV